MAGHEDDASRYRRLMTEALVELESLQGQISRLRAAATEPIAVVGMGCRFPAGANDPEAFWALLRDGVDAVREIPRERWDVDAYYATDGNVPGTVYCRQAALLEQSAVDRFSPEFFGIAPREAERMDPQQRVLLEVCWEALEDAALAADRLRGSRTGVFVGSCTDDYLQLFNNLADPARIDGYSSLGTARCIAAGRIAYLLGLEGPVMQIDTACSSSLVAVHQACASLRSGECDVALAGGVNLQLSPAWTIGLCKLKALSPDGRCKAFDVGADGFGRGEGCGIIILRRLSDAVATGDPIRALIRGSAINHDGRSSGLTVPSQAAQEKLLRQALQSGTLEPHEIDYVEAHGTGTAMGDPIEMGALASVFRGARPPLWVGSVKTNIGHLEAASGIAGMLKVILALGHETIPPHLNFRQPNPNIPWKEFAARIPTGRIAWPRGDRPRLAGVSSFGFSGTNAHVVLQEPPLAGPPAGISRAQHVLPLSAKSHGSLRELAGRYLERLERVATLRLSDVCYTAAVGRTHFSFRLAVVAGTCQQACQGLRAWLRNESAPRVWCATVQQASDGNASQRWPQPLGAEQPDALELVSLAADRFVRGQPIDWEAFYRGVEARRISLPTYPFERQRYWLPPSRVIAPATHRAGQEPDHPLLGRRIHTAASSDAVLFEQTLRTHEPRYLADHCLRDTVVVPATAYLEMAAAAGRILWPGRVTAVEQIAIHRALAIAPDESRNVQTVLSPDSGGYRMELFSRHCPNGTSHSPTWVRHASGRLTATERSRSAKSISELRRLCAAAVPADAVYERIAEQGWRYGPSFRLLRQVWRGTGQALGEVGSLDGSPFDAGGHVFPPALLDACLHVIAALDETNRHGALVPVALERFEVLGSPVPRMWSYATQREPMDADSAGSFTVDLEIFAPDGELLARVRGLQLQEVSSAALTSRTESSSSLGLYQLQWRESPRPATAVTVSLAGNWLLFVDDDDLAESLAQQFTDRGDHCVLISAGSEYNLDGSPAESIRRGSVRRESAADFTRLLRDLCAEAASGLAARQLRGVIHLWSMSLPCDAPAAFDASHRHGCGSALHLIQAMMGSSTQAGLWLVTRGVQQLQGLAPDITSLAQAPLWGFGAVVAVERPELRCVRLDLDPAVPAAWQAKDLLAELSLPGTDNQIAFRGGSRYVPNLVRSLGEPQASVWDRGTILITGGLGDVGLHVATRLIARGARHVVLTSRHDAQSERQHQVLEMLRRSGAEVRVVCADVSRRHEVARLVETVRRTLPPLRGVIHAAGVLDDGVLERLEWAQFERVLAPKAAGAWHLHELVGDVDFFVMFSSAVGLLGAPGQANYAAANAFLDALARYRHTLGLPATSIAWGPWEIGMTARAGDALRSRLARGGIGLIQADIGLDVFERLLEQPLSEVVAIDVDWARLSARMPGNPLWAELAPRIGLAGPDSESWLMRIEQTVPANRLRLLEGLLRAEVAAVLGWESADRVSVKQNLFDLGMDSITSVELQSRLAAHLGRSLPLTLTFDYPNVRALARYVAESLHVSAEAPAEPDGGEEVPADAQRLAAMSEEEVQARLLEKFKQLM